MRLLTEELRAMLKKPFGEVLDEHKLIFSAKGAGPLICVGDYSAAVFLKAGIMPDIAIFDLKTQRQPVGEEIRKELEKIKKPKKISSPPGVITDDLVDAVKEAISKGNGGILIDGEDDLAALVVLAYAKDNAVLVYGLPSQGAVLVRINNENRKKALEIFSKMKEV
jgi:GTP-dependent dephospho-CoA kinase